MAWAVRQSKSLAVSSGSPSVTFGSTLVSGSKIVVHLAISASTGGVEPVSSVKDGAGNTWTKLASFQGTSGSDWHGLYALDTPAGDVGTAATITVSVASNFGVTVIIEEGTGLLAGNTSAMLDGTPATNSGASSTGPATSGAYSTTAASELLIVSVGDDGNTVTISNSTGYTPDPNNVNASGTADLFVAWKNSTGGAESSSFALSGADDWGTVIAAFKLAAAATLIPPGRVLRQRAAVVRRALTARAVQGTAARPLVRPVAELRQPARLVKAPRARVATAAKIPVVPPLIPRSPVLRQRAAVVRQALAARAATGRVVAAAAQPLIPPAVTLRHRVRPLARRLAARAIGGQPPARPGQPVRQAMHRLATPPRLIARGIKPPGLPAAPVAQRAALANPRARVIPPRAVRAGVVVVTAAQPVIMGGWLRQAARRVAAPQRRVVTGLVVVQVAQPVITARVLAWPRRAAASGQRGRAATGRPPAIATGRSMAMPIRPRPRPQAARCVTGRPPVTAGAACMRQRRAPLPPRRPGTARRGIMAFVPPVTPIRPCVLRQRWPGLPPRPHGTVINTRQVLAGLRPGIVSLSAGAPHGRWSAGEPGGLWAASEPHGSRWTAGLPHGRYDAGTPHTAWAVAAPHK